MTHRMKNFKMMGDNVCIKIPKRYDSYTCLNRRQSIKQEKKVLIRLNKNFECICGKKKENHFPLYLNNTDRELVLSYCGNNLLIESVEKINDIEEQINCISYNLKKSNIMQIDLGYPGQNLCIKNGTLFMIDFGMSVIDNEITERIGYQIKKHSERRLGINKNTYVKNYYEIIKDELKWIINNNKIFDKKSKIKKRKCWRKVGNEIKERFKL